MFLKNYNWINQKENCEFKVYFDWGLRKPIENLSLNIDIGKVRDKGFSRFDE